MPGDENPRLLTNRLTTLIKLAFRGRPTSPWAEAAYLTLFNLAGMLLPLFVVYLTLRAMKLKVQIGAFTDGGEFALYTIASVIPTIYFIAKDSTRIPFSRLFALIAVVAIVLAIVFFVLARIADNGAPIEKATYRIPSIILFLAVVIVSFLATAFNARPAPIRLLQQQDTQDYEHFKKDFLMGKGGSGT